MIQKAAQPVEERRESLTESLTRLDWDINELIAELTSPPDIEGGRTESSTSPPSSAHAEGPSPELGSDDSLEIGGQPKPGESLFERYQVIRQLGEGGMGVVWLVRHLELDAERALKVIAAGIAFNHQMRARFRREARVMARLAHPNAVTVHDARIGRGAAFIEMEYIRGESLNRLLQPGVPMPLDWVARILEQLCDVLQTAHDLKIVHRDLKPANLMLVAGRPVGKEQLKVLDFGIAKLLEADLTASDVRTRTGCFMGSAAWSSPEQATDGRVDARSDLYSVGVILYELVTGYRPFGGPLTKVLYDHLYTPPPPFAEKNPQVQLPPAIEHVILHCLEKKAEDRPQSARELFEEFLSAQSGGPVISRGFTSSSFSDVMDARTELSPPSEPPIPVKTEPGFWSQSSEAVNSRNAWILDRPTIRGDGRSAVWTPLKTACQSRPDSGRVSRCRSTGSHGSSR